MRKDLDRTSSASVAEHFRRPWLFLAVLSVFTFIVYSVSLSFQFVWDDIFQIVDNPMIRSWANIPQIFGSDLWHYVHRGQLYYRPLFATWAVLNYSLFKLNPWGWHLTSILVHLVAVLVVYDLARRLRLPYWTSAAAAALFALHPIHIECVSWVSAASDSMVTIFYVLAFSAFLRFREPQQPRRLFWRIASLALLACALLTKEMAVTFCGIVAAYVWIFPVDGHAGVARKIKEALTAAWPYLVLTLLYLVLRKYAMSAVIAPAYKPPTVEQFLFTLPYVLAYYLRQLVFPAGLTGLYYTPYISARNFALFVVCLGALVAYAVAVRWMRRKTGDRTIIFLGLWPLLTLLPALYLPNFGHGDFVRDRYIYLPSVGFILLVARALALVPKVGRLKAQTLQMAAVVLLISGCVAGSLQQGYWTSERAIFERGYQLYPNNMYAAVGLARVLQREGEPEKSIQLLTDVIAKDPERLTAYYLLAEAYSRVGKQAEGRALLAQALALTKNPTEGELETADLAGLYGRLGDYDAAQRLCSKVLAEAQDLFSALYNCGVVSFQLANYQQAEKLLSHAVEVAPDEPGANYWLGRVYLQTNRATQAQSAFRTAVRIRPDAYEYHYRLAEALEKAGDLPNATLEYRETLRLSPGAEAATQHLKELQARP